MLFLRLDANMKLLELMNQDIDSPPENYLKLLQTNGKGTREELLLKWDKAKNAVLKSTHPHTFASVMSVFRLTLLNKAPA